MEEMKSSSFYLVSRWKENYQFRSRNKKFLVSYDPDGMIEKNASKDIIPVLYNVDKKKDCKIWKKIRNNIEEMN